MFILIRASVGVISDESKVTAYGTYDEAFAAMIESVHVELVEHDRDFEYTEGGSPKAEDNDGFYCIDATHSFVEPCGGTEWHIYEVPGVLIPSDVAEGIREDVAEMESIYANEGVDEKWDADDIAIDVARTVASLVG